MRQEATAAIGSAHGHARASITVATMAVEVNEETEPARRFDERMGFAVVGRSPLDAQGRPHPLLQMRRDAPTA